MDDRVESPRNAVFACASGLVVKRGCHDLLRLAACSPWRGCFSPGHRWDRRDDGWCATHPSTVRTSSGSAHDGRVGEEGDRSLTLAEDDDLAQVPVVLAVIEAVTDDKLVLDGEPDVIDLNIDLSPGRLAEQTCGTKAPGITGPQDFL